MDAVTRPDAIPTDAPVSESIGRRAWGAPVSVNIENVAKSFGVTAALHGVSLDIQPGELIALLGPSGSGKTTLLRILAGLEVPSEGRVLFDGEDALGLPVQKRHIGFVFQSYALFRHMTVTENISFGLRVRPASRRPDRRVIRQRVEDLLALVQLEGLGGRYPNQLSGGQRQRVALARALAVEPRVLLLDEPFGALDAKVRKDLRRWLREIHDRTGHTTVFVTHDQEEALELSDRVVVMNEGHIQQVGSPDEIYDEPATPFVASFIGESNLLPVTVRAGTVLFEGSALPLAPAAAADGPATLVFRPHEAVLADEPGAIRARVVAERRNGPQRRLEVESVAGCHRFEVNVPAGSGRLVGGEVQVRPNRWRLFPAG